MLTITLLNLNLPSKFTIVINLLIFNSTVDKMEKVAQTLVDNTGKIHALTNVRAGAKIALASTTDLINGLKT